MGLTVGLPANNLGTVLKRPLRLVIVGLVTGVLGGALIDSLPTLMANRLFEWPQPIQMAITALLMALAFYVVNSFFGYRVRHFANEKHPPAPIAGIIGGVTFAAVFTCDYIITAEVLALSIASYVVSLLAVGRTPHLEEIRPAFNERPIQTQAEDLFGHLPIAQGLADRIRAKSGPILLVGRFGSGKTSLCNLVYDLLCEEAKKKPGSSEWIKVSISGWGIESPEARAREILGTICEHLGEEVDTLSLREQCRGFIQSVFGDFHWLSKMLFSMQASSTRSISDQLDLLLKSSNKRALVILDDFERNVKDDTGNYNWNSGVSEVVEHLKHSQQVKFIACVNRESLQ